MKQIGIAALKPRWPWLRMFGVKESYVRIFVSSDGIIIANLADKNWYKYNTMMRLLYRYELLI